jgi:AAA ATPase domain
MAADKVNRPAEEGAVREFLDSASSAPSALLIDGEPGIGKTTLWSAACERARQRGFQVLSATAATAEPVSAYTSLADLLNGLDPAMWADLPAPQRVAVGRVLLRETAAGTATDQRAVAAGFLSIVDLLALDEPVLLAIDDLQWLDPSSLHVIAFAARRLAGPVGFLGAVRTEPDDGATVDWLQLPRPDAVHRIQLHPLSIGAMQTVLSDHLGWPLPRPILTRIQHVSAGNPFYAIELAREVDFANPRPEMSLPRTLAGPVNARIGRLDRPVHRALLAASCLAAPTVELICQVTDTDSDQLLDLLANAERKDVIAIEGHRLRFTHPILAAGVHTAATTAQRQAMHRRLAEVLEEPELQRLQGDLPARQ